MLSKPWSFEVEAHQGKNSRMLKLKLDPGATLSHISMALADNMGWMRTKAIKLEAQMANGSTTVGDEKVVLDLILEPGKPARTVHFACMKDLPKDPRYALLGRVDMEGLYYNYGEESGGVGFSCTSQGSTESDPLQPPKPEMKINQEEGWQRVRFGTGLSETQGRQCKELVQEFKEVFEPLNTDPAKLEPFYISLTPEAKPFRARHRSFTSSKQAFFVKEISLWS